MKRAALNLLDHILVGIWTAFVLFLAGATVLLLGVPRKWQENISSQDVFEVCLLVLCLLSSSRFLNYLERPQWIIVGCYVILIPLYLWLSPQGTLLRQMSSAVVASWILILIFVPLYKVVRPYVRIKFGTKTSRHAERIQREQVLRDMVASSKEKN